MKKFLKGLMTITLVFVFAIALTGCGKETNNGGGTTGGNDNQQQGGTTNNCTDTKSNDSFVSKYDYAYDYMMPDDGVYTGYKGQNMYGDTDDYFYFSVTCITKDGLKNYTDKLLANGFEEAISGISYKNKDKNIKITISDYVSTSNSINVYVYPSLDI